MKIEDLKSQILSANKAYRDGHPIMSDQAFDDLCDKLSNLISGNEYASFRDSLNEGKGKMKHPFVMGSLDKLKRECPEDVISFVKSLGPKINISAKVDGISARASYKAGKLVSLSTRGNGFFGENLTDKAKFINNLPQELVDNVEHKLIDDEDIDVRGELVILKDDFIKLNNAFDGKFANPRNACAGIMNRKDWTEDEVKYVTFVPYTILGYEYSKREQFSILSMVEGMKTAWNVDIEIDSIDDIMQTLTDYASQDFEYETDGLVVCSSEYRNEDKYRPDMCKAFKMNMLTAETYLVDVSWEGPSKDGFFIGVGIVDPVELGGSTISRVSLHNLDIIENLGLMYGSKIQITKSGDIIPHIDKVIDNSRNCTKIVLPTECSCCGSTLVRDGINMRCMNKDCPDQVINRLVLFIKKLGVKSASNATLKNFGIDSFEKLVNFTPNKKYKSEVKLYDELCTKMFSQSKERLLQAMNFSGLSETLVGKIISHYGYEAIESDNFKDIAYKSLPMGIGNITLEKFIDGLPDAIRYIGMIVNDIRWNYVKDDSGSSRATSSIKGSICVTGSLKFGSRNKFLEFAKQHGYESKSGVSKGLTYLITNDMSSGSSKNKKAKDLGIKVLSEDEFMKMIQSENLEDSSLFSL